MTISSRVRQQFYDPKHQLQQLIRIAPTRKPRTVAATGAATSSTTIVTNAHEFSDLEVTTDTTANSSRNRLWTEDEHERFLEAIEKYPNGPWKAIADHIGNKTARQAMSHAQKYRQKIARRQRGLQVARRKRKTVENKTTDLALKTTSSKTPPKQRSKLTATEKLALEEQQQELLGNEGGLYQEVSEEIQVCHPRSPTEVSFLPSSMKEENLEWLTTVPMDQEIDEFELELEQLASLDEEQFSSISQDLCFQSSIELLQHFDDHNMIVNSVRDFLDSLEVDQLALDGNCLDQSPLMWCGAA